MNARLVYLLTVPVFLAQTVGCHSRPSGRSKHTHVREATRSVPIPSASAPATTNTNISPVHGLWEQRPFVARAALATPRPHNLHLVLLNRAAKCDSSSIREADMAITVDIPTGPHNNYFTGKSIPLSLRLFGAGGVNQVPAAEASITLSAPNAADTNYLRGSLSFAYKTAADQGAPSYQSQGQFKAMLCSGSRADGPAEDASSTSTTRSPVDGAIGAKEVRLLTAVVYTRKSALGKTILSLRLHAGTVKCFGKLAGTPYLFGADVGPGPDGSYYQGRQIPMAWKLRIKQDAFSEETVRTRNDEGWLKLEHVDLRAGRIVTGVLHVTHRPKTERKRFHFDGRFRARVCGSRAAAW